MPVNWINCRHTIKKWRASHAVHVNTLRASDLAGWLTERKCANAGLCKMDRKLFSHSLNEIINLGVARAANPRPRRGGFKFLRKKASARKEQKLIYNIYVYFLCREWVLRVCECVCDEFHRIHLRKLNPHPLAPYALEQQYFSTPDADATLFHPSTRTAECERLFCARRRRLCATKEEIVYATRRTMCARVCISLSWIWQMCIKGAVSSPNGISQTVSPFIFHPAYIL